MSWLRKRWSQLSNAAGEESPAAAPSTLLPRIVPVSETSGKSATPAPQKCPTCNVSSATTSASGESQRLQKQVATLRQQLEQTRAAHLREISRLKSEFAARIRDPGRPEESVVLDVVQVDNGDNGFAAQVKQLAEMQQTIVTLTERVASYKELAAARTMLFDRSIQLLREVVNRQGYKSVKDFLDHAPPVKASQSACSLENAARTVDRDVEAQTAIANARDSAVVLTLQQDVVAKLDLEEAAAAIAKGDALFCSDMWKATPKMGSDAEAHTKTGSNANDDPNSSNHKQGTEHAKARIATLVDERRGSDGRGSDWEEGGKETAAMSRPAARKRFVSFSKGLAVPSLSWVQRPATDKSRRASLFVNPIASLTSGSSSSRRTSQGVEGEQQGKEGEEPSTEGKSLQPFGSLPSLLVSSFGARSGQRQSCMPAMQSRTQCILGSPRSTPGNCLGVSGVAENSQSLALGPIVGCQTGGREDTCLSRPDGRELVGRATADAATSTRDWLCDTHGYPVDSAALAQSRISFSSAGDGQCRMSDTNADSGDFFGENLRRLSDGLEEPCESSSDESDTVAMVQPGGGQQKDRHDVLVGAEHSTSSPGNESVREGCSSDRHASVPLHRRTWAAGKVTRLHSAFEAAEGQALRGCTKVRTGHATEADACVKPSSDEVNSSSVAEASSVNVAVSAAHSSMTTAGSTKCQNRAQKVARTVSDSAASKRDARYKTLPSGGERQHGENAPDVVVPTSVSLSTTNNSNLVFVKKEPSFLKGKASAR